MEERRLKGGRLLRKRRLSGGEIGRRLGVSRMAVSQWAQRMRSGGLRRLRQRKASGRPPRLRPDQRRALLRILKRGALAAGFSTDRWTLARIQLIIRREFGVHYHPNYLSALLHQWGWSCQRPIAQARERDDDQVETWLRQTWPRIQKKARRLRIEIVFFDEFGFSFQEPLGRTWAPQGQPPIVRRLGRYRRELSSAVGLTRSGKIYLRHFFHALCADDVIVALKHIHRQIGRSFILVWDHAPTHEAKSVTGYFSQHPEIHEEWLPAYAPDLNPEEYCHGNVKQRLKNVLPTDKIELRDRVNTQFARLRRRPDLILGFFHHAGLNVKQLS